MSENQEVFKYMKKWYTGKRKRPITKTEKTPVIIKDKSVAEPILEPEPVTELATEPEPVTEPATEPTIESVLDMESPVDLIKPRRRGKTI